MRVFAEAKGIDIALALYGPGGERVAARDRSQEFGYETLSWIAEASGDYHLEVRPFKSAPPPAPYQAKLEDLRPATPDDRHRVAGEEAETAANSSTGGWRRVIEIMRSLSFIGAPSEIGRGRPMSSLPWSTSSPVRVSCLSNWRPRPRPLSSSARWGTGAGRRQRSTELDFAFRELGETQKALDCYREALALAQAAGDSAQGVYLASVGTIYADLGDLDAALDSYQRALPFARISGALYEAQTLDRIGDVYVRLGDRDHALEAKAREVDIWRAEGRVPMLALALDRLGEACVEFGEHRRALEYFTEALALYRSRQHADGQSRSLTDLGLVHERLGERQKALDLYQQALDLGGIYESDARMRAGAIYASMGQWNRALEHYTAALPQFRAWSDPKGEADALIAMGEAHAALGDVVEARRCVELAVETIETRRARVASPELRAFHLSSNRRYYESYINLLMQLHRTRPSERFDAAALEVSERARARVLLDLLNEARADIRQGADPTLVDELRRLEARIDALEQRRLSAPKGKSEPSDEQEVKSLILEHRDLEGRIRLKSPRYAALIHPRPLPLDDTSDTSSIRRHSWSSSSSATRRATPGG